MWGTSFQLKGAGAWLPNTTHTCLQDDPDKAEEKLRQLPH